MASLVRIKVEETYQLTLSGDDVDSLRKILNVVANTKILDDYPELKNVAVHIHRVLNDMLML